MTHGTPHSRIGNHWLVMLALARGNAEQKHLSASFHLMAVEEQLALSTPISIGSMRVKTDAEALEITWVAKNSEEKFLLKNRMKKICPIVFYRISDISASFFTDQVIKTGGGLSWDKDDDKKEEEDSKRDNPSNSFSFSLLHFPLNFHFSSCCYWARIDVFLSPIFRQLSPIMPKISNRPNGPKATFSTRPIVYPALNDFRCIESLWPIGLLVYFGPGFLLRRNMGSLISKNGSRSLTGRGSKKTSQVNQREAGSNCPRDHLCITASLILWFPEEDHSFSSLQTHKSHQFPFDYNC